MKPKLTKIASPNVVNVDNKVEYINKTASMHGIQEKQGNMNKSI